MRDVQKCWMHWIVQSFSWGMFVQPFASWKHVSPTFWWCWRGTPGMYVRSLNVFKNDIHPTTVDPLMWNMFTYGICCTSKLNKILTHSKNGLTGVHVHSKRTHLTYHSFPNPPFWGSNLSITSLSLYIYIYYLSLHLQVPPQKVFEPSKPTPVPPSQKVRLEA